MKLKNLHQWNPESNLEIIKGANHVFEARHPWNQELLPKELKEVVDKVAAFLSSK